jgi:hypothetical protein
MTVTRRGIFKLALAGFILGRRSRAEAAEDLKVRDNTPPETFDFEAKGIESWTTVDGQWTVEDMASAPSGKKVLVQRATKNQFNVIVAPPGPFTDVEVSIKFKPMSGKEDASGGIVLRFNDGRYYVVRTNALEDNFRLYGINWRRRASRRQRLVSGIRFASWLSAITFRPGSTASSTWTTTTRASRQVEWGSGRRPIRSRHSMTS